MSLLAERPATLTRRDPQRHAERVQRALSTCHELSVGAVSAACDVREALGVGGDIVDLLEIDGRLLAVLGDVSGKGSAASLVAAMLLASVQHHAPQTGPRPGALLMAVDASMKGVLDRTGTIVTLVLAAIDPGAKTLRMASAGHHPVVMWSRSGGEFIVPTCPPMGAVPPCGAELELHFPPGTTLALVSDGVTEQPDACGAEFGLTGLQRVLASAGSDPRRVVADVLESVDRHAVGTDVFDDRAALIVRSGG
jgi:serine phosphatase RsbU (regulator of sigma subunit)